MHKQAVSSVYRGKEAFVIRCAMKTTRNLYSLREDLYRAATLLLLPLWLFCVPFAILHFGFNGLPPRFSVQLTDVIRNPDPVAPASPPVSGAAYNITLHAINRRHKERCYRQGEAAVLYAGLTVAWGRTPRFCVGAMDARDVTVVAWADEGFELPIQVRDKMARERRAGSVELAVDVRLFRGDDGSARPTWMRCKVTTDGPEPPGAAPCTVFALQNWASDIAPSWME